LEMPPDAVSHISGSAAPGPALSSLAQNRQQMSQTVVFGLAARYPFIYWCLRALRAAT
jgi:hypothetical protein